MIRELAVELQTNQRAQGCPVVVIDGPEPYGTASFGRERIVLEHGESDSFDPPWSHQPNPKRRMVRNIGAKLTVYAQSTKAGAMPFEHRRRCEQILDMALVGLSKIQSVRKGRGAFLPSGGRFIVPEDLAASERAGGAVYELAFSFQRAVEDVTWTGAAQPEAEIDGGVDGVGITNSTRVSINGSETYEYVPEV
jgi:hypothetical protein